MRNTLVLVGLVALSTSSCIRLKAYASAKPQGDAIDWRVIPVTPKCYEVERITFHGEECPNEAAVRANIESWAATYKVDLTKLWGSIFFVRHPIECGGKNARGCSNGPQSWVYMEPDRKFVYVDFWDTLEHEACHMWMFHTTDSTDPGHKGGCYP